MTAKEFLQAFREAGGEAGLDEYGSPAVACYTTRQSEIYLDYVAAADKDGRDGRAEIRAEIAAEGSRIAYAS